MQQTDLANLNFSLTKAGLTGISGAVTTFSTGAAGVLCCFGGKFVQVTQASGVAMPTSDAVQKVLGVAVNFSAIPIAVNQGATLVFAYTAAGAIQVAISNIVNLDPLGNFIGWAPQEPTLPDTICPFSYVVVKNGATGTGPFTVGTSPWNQTGMSYSVQDIAYVTGRPQIA